MNRRLLTFTIFISVAILTGIGIAYLNGAISNEQTVRRFVVQNIKTSHNGITIDLLNTKLQKIESLTLRYCTVTIKDYVFLPVWVYRDPRTSSVTDEQIIRDISLCSRFNAPA